MRLQIWRANDVYRIARRTHPVYWHFAYLCGIKTLVARSGRIFDTIEARILPDEAYLLNKPGKSVALTGRIEEIRSGLDQCNALAPKY